METGTAVADAGAQVAVREVRPESPNPAKHPVLQLHGARVLGVASFDLPVGLVRCFGR